MSHYKLSEIRKKSRRLKFLLIQNSSRKCTKWWSYFTHNRGSPHNENYLRQKSKVLRQIFRQMFVSTEANMNFQIAAALASLICSVPICLGTKLLFDRIATWVYKNLNTLLNNWSLQPKSWCQVSKYDPRQAEGDFARFSWSSPCFFEISSYVLEIQVIRNL